MVSKLWVVHPRSRIPDPGVKKAPDPGSRSATLLWCGSGIFYKTRLVWKNSDPGGPCFSLSHIIFCCRWRKGPCSWPWFRIRGGAGLRSRRPRTTSVVKKTEVPAHTVQTGQLAERSHETRELPYSSWDNRSQATQHVREFSSLSQAIILSDLEKKHCLSVDPFFQCCGSMTFWNGSGSPDPCLWLVDPDSDPDPGSGFFYFCHWPSRCQQKTKFLTQFFLLITFWSYIYTIFQI